MRVALVVIVLVAASTFALWQAERGATLAMQLQLRALAARTATAGTLEYEDVQSHFWGAGRISGLRFTPDAQWLANRGWPAGLALEIPELRYRGWQPGPEWPAAFEWRFEQAMLPLPSPLPQRFSGTLSWSHALPGGALDLRLSLDAPGTAAVDTELKLTAPDPARWREAVLRGAGLRYRDQGLAQGWRAGAAAKLGADPRNAETALAEALQQQLASWGLPASTALRKALADFAHEPLALTLRLEPPGELRLGQLDLYAPADREAALGLTADAR